MLLLLLTVRAFGSRPSALPHARKSPWLHRSACAFRGIPTATTRVYLDRRDGERLRLCARKRQIIALACGKQAPARRNRATKSPHTSGWIVVEVVRTNCGLIACNGHEKARYELDVKLLKWLQHYRRDVQHLNKHICQSIICEMV